jgi:hypothetical protein
LTTHHCVRPTSETDKPWRCPDCGLLWEALPPRPAGEPAPEPVADPAPWEQERSLKMKDVAIIALVVAIALAYFTGSFLIVPLGLVGIAGLAWLFWQTVRK